MCFKTTIRNRKHTIYYSLICRKNKKKKDAICTNKGEHRERASTVAWLREQLKHEVCTRRWWERLNTMCDDGDCRCAVGPEVEWFIEKWAKRRKYNSSSRTPTKGGERKREERGKKEGKEKKRSWLCESQKCSGPNRKGRTERVRNMNTQIKPNTKGDGDEKSDSISIVYITRTTTIYYTN